MASHRQVRVRPSSSSLGFPSSSCVGLPSSSFLAAAPPHPSLAFPPHPHLVSPPHPPLAFPPHPHLASPPRASRTAIRGTGSGQARAAVAARAGAAARRRWQGRRRRSREVRPWLSGAPPRGTRPSPLIHTLPSPLRRASTSHSPTAPRLLGCPCEVEWEGVNERGGAASPRARWGAISRLALSQPLPSPWPTSGGGLLRMASDGF